LVNLLEPAGLINIGLYSKIGRRHITQARNFCHAKGFKPDTEGIRLSRQMIYTQASRHPIKDVLNMHDFFSLSECRDLIFHAQETCYDLSEIMNMLDKAGLQFIGFESANPTIKSKFQNRYPGNSSMTDIRLWRQFEQENPDTFKEMYVFWCQKLPHKPTFNQKLVK